MGPCNRSKEGVCAEEGESVSIVERRKREGKGIYSGAAEERIYPAVKVIANSTSILCRKEGWKEMDGVRLQVFE